MDFVTFLWAGLIAAGAGFPATAIGVLGMAPARYRDAKILFIISGLSIECIAALFWLTIPVSTLVRILGTVAIAALGAIGTIKAIKWVTNIEQSSTVALFIDFSMLRPTIIPESGQLFMVMSFGHPISVEPGGFSIYHSIPGSSYDDGRQNFLYYRCQLFNYGSKAITNLSFFLRLVFKLMEPDPDQPTAMRSGEVFLDREWPLLVPKLDPGKDNPFEFYISNPTDYFLQVGFSNRATFVEMGGTTIISREISKKPDPIILPPPRVFAKDINPHSPDDA